MKHYCLILTFRGISSVTRINEEVFKKLIAAEYSRIIFIKEIIQNIFIIYNKLILVNDLEIVDVMYGRKGTFTKAI